MNYKFDIDEWLPRCPLELSNGHYDGEIVTGPRDICNNERLRTEMQDQFDWGPAVAMDIFVMADGEPPNRWVTKIGGLPYRPTGLDWPTTSDGDPLLFLAQFDFSDSRDIVGDLPGDILLVFADYSDGAVKPATFEWLNLGETNLITPNEMTDHRFSFAPCYGYLCRTVSFPSARAIPKAKGQKYSKCRGADVWSSYHVPEYQATQIGEAPYFIQRRDEEQPGRILCTISSVHPNQHRPYPFLNRPEPLMPEGKWDFHSKYLMMGDVGCIYISIDETNELFFSDSCY